VAIVDSWMFLNDMNAEIFTARCYA